ncbi:MAG: nitrilase-related carbon-nitrogen hydrolase [Anaerolineae bacterium]
MMESEQRFGVVGVSGSVAEVTLSFSRDLDRSEARKATMYELSPDDAPNLEAFAIGKFVTLSGLALERDREYKLRISEGVTDEEGNSLAPNDREVVYVPHYLTRRVRASVAQPLWASEWAEYFHYGVRAGKPVDEAYLDYVTELVEEAGQLGSDIVCLPEVAYCDAELCGSPEQTIPGPFFDRMAEKAAHYAMYVIACLKELVDGKARTFAFIADRQGALLGKYHKVHEPDGKARAARGEVGLGAELPVFDTDFGRIAIMVCFDQISVEMPRIYAAKGADILFLPDGTGGVSTGCEINTMLRAQAWALDNCVFVVPCRNARLIDRGPGAFGRSCIIDRSAIVVADAGRTDGVASAVIDLEKKRMVYGYGTSGINDAHYRLFQERRPELFREITDPDLVGQ